MPKRKVVECTRSGHPKVKHRSVEGATLHAEMLIQRKKTVDTLSIYACRWCGYFHVGRPSWRSEWSSIKGVVTHQSVLDATR